MGEVYRAKDARVDRTVALKVLPGDFLEGEERKARFSREAKLLASLNHPGIATLYSFEEISGRSVLSMELVEGSDISQLLSSGPLSLEESLSFARQIAEALEAAHEKGIVHRDLKPANVKVTPEGRVKLLDFGLAKALVDVSSPDLSTSPTLTAAATQAGVALGTVAYMSPEQARAKPVDKRADVWAFGAVLYEMLTGRRAFAGDTVSDTLAAVLKTDPDWSALAPATPAAVRRLLRRCLQKEPSRRLRDIGDARIEIEEAIQEASSEPTSATGPALGSHRSILAGLLAGIAIGAVAAGLIFSQRRPGASDVPMRFLSVTNFSGMEIQPSLSPDGRSVAFVSNRDGAYDIWVGLVAGGRLVRITDDANVESHPQWSPDGTRIAYARLKDSGFSDIWEVPALGGAPRRVIVDATEPAWSPDGRTLAYSNLATGTIWSCDASGANARAVTQPELGYGPPHRQPAFSHDGKRVVFVQRLAGPYGELLVMELASRLARTLTHDRALAYSPVWSPDDRFLYFASSRGGTINIWKMASDGGEPQQITAGQGDDADLSLSADGKRLVFSTYRQNINIGVADLEAKGQSAGLKWVTSDAARGEIAPAFSPDGRRIAYFSNRKGVEREGIWVMDVDGANAAPLVVDDNQNVFPRWYADGQALLFRSSDARLGRPGDRYRRVAISGGPPEVVLSEPMGLWVDVDSQGRILGNDAQGRGVIYDPMTRQKRVLEACVGGGFRWNRDGRRIAYFGPPGGLQAGLWVYDFQGAPRQVFSGWLVNFAWAGSEELVYAEGKPDRTALFWSVLRDGSGRQRIPLTIRLEGAAWEMSPTSNFDVSADRRRIAVQAGEQSEADIGMIENVR